MKIIGHTTWGYLLEADASEIELIGGPLRRNAGGMAPVGTVIPASERFTRACDLENLEEDAKKAAASLRAFADLLDGPVAKVKFPEEPKPGEQKAEG